MARRHSPIPCRTETQHGDEAANGVQKQLIKRAKDIAAAGVLLSALTALILGILFLVIPFIQSFR
jgi:Prokaryotic diacylglycerol kinase